MTLQSLEVTAAHFSEAHSPFLSPRRVSELLGVTQSELATLIGVARNTLTAASGARKVDQALSPVVRILAMAAEMGRGRPEPRSHLVQASADPGMGRQDRL